ncbi:MAG: class I SAM-dependent methyltransferase [Thaumarchaeota archaeon]|nr:class I SAM-dependent methyltransferase [Nitrososphaerota archaeon]MBT3744265.1 class I SAM-dependent methyltransferase [Nitrososphaerota archaeon]MBT4057222.1 class I SAM-dependent methyltransferase [Nitrososphaerota archaeon]MBT4176326.1 class I SAM-dependent methyltransferase [Nitrososphaerota archaeon]MBT4509561.1 class I SAM-dependent methyltransferase [Nitrososphaerota archaeon]
MKIEEYLSTLPKSIISGEEIQIPPDTIREIFRFTDLEKNDTFYHLGCGDGTSLVIAREEFNVKNAIGIDNSEKMISEAKKMIDKKNIANIKVIEQDVRQAEFNDADVILCWFMDPEILEDLIDKFKKLKSNVRIITIWAPLPGCLPQKVDFPYIMNKTPFDETDNLKKQLMAVFDTECIGFVTAWEYAERYTKSIGRDNPENDRFLVIIQALTIWINAKNLGVACGEEIPVSIKSYIAILKEYFGIEVEHLLK